MSGVKLLNIDRGGHMPKYRQIIRSVERAIAEGRLRRHDRLPSVNQICLAYSLSRDTVLLAYEELKKRGIVYSILGKGYFVKTMEVWMEQRVFLLFDELNAFKEEIYNSFLVTIDKQIRVDIYFHHFNLDMFKKLVAEINGNYAKYIIMPTNMAGTAPIIKTLPAQDVIILDQTNPELAGYPSVHQHFAQDMYDGLLKGRSLIDKYRQLVLLYPGNKEPIGMVEGFLTFCRAHSLPHEVREQFRNDDILPGTVFIIPNDRDLVNVIEQARSQQLTIGRDVGIISYNDIPLKKVVEKGITTISTDFAAMGRTLADFVMHGRKDQVKNPSDLIIRQTL